MLPTKRDYSTLSDITNTSHIVEQLRQPVKQPIKKMKMDDGTSHNIFGK